MTHRTTARIADTIWITYGSLLLVFSILMVGYEAIRYISQYPYMYTLHSLSFLSGLMYILPRLEGIKSGIMYSLSQSQAVIRYHRIIFAIVNAVLSLIMLFYNDYNIYIDGTSDYHLRSDIPRIWSIVAFVCLFSEMSFHAYAARREK